MSKKMMIFYSFPINFSLKILNDRALLSRLEIIGPEKARI